MKKFLLFFLIHFIALVLAQKQPIDAQIVTFDNDTLNVKVIATTNMFDKKMIYGSSFNNNFKYEDGSGKKLKMETQNVKEISFTDFDNKKRFFLNNSDDRKTLTEVVFEGEYLAWSRVYFSSYGGENAKDYLFNKKTKQGIPTIYLAGIPKKKLIEFFSDEPEMEAFINASESSSLRNAENNIYVVMESIIKKYESLKSNNK